MTTRKKPETRKVKAKALKGTKAKIKDLEASKKHGNVKGGPAIGFGMRISGD